MSTKNTQVSKPKKKMCICTIKNNNNKQTKKKDKKNGEKKNKKNQQGQGVLNKPDIR